MSSALKIYVDESVGIGFFWPNSVVAVTLAECWGKVIERSSLEDCTIAVFGPYSQSRASLASRFGRKIWPRKNADCTRLYVTMENTRPDFGRYDFCIGPDLGISSDNFFRLPYWMYVLNWPSLVQRGVTYSRYGSLLSIERLMEPLGAEFLSRNRKAVLMCKHLTEPRKSLYDSICKNIEVDGFGAAFNKGVKHHNQSSIVKSELLSKYTFNLCPENSMHPGYYTEKIPESFHAGCLPLSWTDPHVESDFNPKCFVNFYHADQADQSNWLATLMPDLDRFSEEPLLLNKPSLDGLRNFLSRVLDAAC